MDILKFRRKHVFYLWVVFLFLYFGGLRLVLNMWPHLSSKVYRALSFDLSDTHRDTVAILSFHHFPRHQDAQEDGMKVNSNNSKDDSNPGQHNSTSLSEFRQRFLRWHNDRSGSSPVPGPDRVTTSGRYLIYRCDGPFRCGGWADRVLGMIDTYLIANLTDREFKADVLFPACNLTDILMPNLVNWSLPVSFNKSLFRNKPNTKTINLIDNVRFVNTMDRLNFTLYVGNKTFVYFKTNIDYSLGFRASLVYADQLSWMKSLSADQILSTVYKRLFKLSPSLQTRVEEFLARALPSPKHKLVCAHVRMGRNPSIPNDTEVRATNAVLPNVWKFLNQHAPADFHTVFVMSDSEEVLQQAKNQTFASRLVTTPGTIRHVDRAYNAPQKEVCDSEEKVAFEQHLLMNCDVMMLSRSGLSRMAAYVRGTDSGLYCLVKNGSVIPCQVSKIKEIYNV